MTVSTHRLTKDISLSVIGTDKFKSGLLTLTLSLPLSAKSSVYNMLLAGILKRGNEKYRSLADINRRLDELYDSSLDIRSSRLGKNLSLVLSSDMLEGKFIPDGTDTLDGVLEVMEETLLHPLLEDGLFPIAVFEQEKRFLLDAINASSNNTRSYASLRLAELMMAQDKEYPTLEEMKDILATVNRKALTEYFFNTVLHSPVHFFYIGAEDTATLSEKLLSRFASWRALPFTPVMPYAEPICELRHGSEKMSVNQGKLALGFKTGSCIGKGDAHYAVILFNEIFGGSPASKLFMNVRERLSLCYYCSSSYNQYMGTLTVSSGIDPSNRAVAEAAILSELEDIRNGKISDTELHAAKASIANSFRQFLDNPYDLQSYYGNRAFFGFEEDMETVSRKIALLTATDVAAVAKRTVLDSIFYIEGVNDGE